MTNLPFFCAFNVVNDILLGCADLSVLELLGLLAGFFSSPSKHCSFPEEVGVLAMGLNPRLIRFARLGVLDNFAKFGVDSVTPRLAACCSGGCGDFIDTSGRAGAFTLPVRSCGESARKDIRQICFNHKTIGPDQSDSSQCLLCIKKSNHAHSLLATI